MKEIKKDITTVTHGIIAHGVNCQGVMRSGVAKAIREKWPEVYEAYMTVKPSRDLLGAAQGINVSNDLRVYNCWTQEYYGRDGRRYASPSAVYRALRRVFDDANAMRREVYLPKIGCGLGGLDWETEVKPMVEKFEKHFGIPNVYICDI
jgi:O-acetyl-ADP-ribose deacetylase (regulator of RNase III)